MNMHANKKILGTFLCKTEEYDLNFVNFAVLSYGGARCIYWLQVLG